VTFASGSTPLGTGTLNGSGVATLSTTSLPAGTDSLTATYAAVGNFAASTSPALTLTISSGVASAQPGYSVAASPTSLTIPIGEAGNTTLTFTPTGGYSGSILLSCLNLPANAVCAFAQSQVALGGNNQTINLKLTIKTSAQQARSTPHNLLSSPLLAMAFWWPGGLTGFAVFVRKRKPVKTQHFWHLDLRLVGALVLAAGLSGCGMSGIAIGPGATSEVTVVATGISGTAVTTQTVVLTVRMMQ
jgi:hypothetical protein